MAYEEFLKPLPLLCNLVLFIIIKILAKIILFIIIIIIYFGNVKTNALCQSSSCFEWLSRCKMLEQLGPGEVVNAATAMATFKASSGTKCNSCGEREECTRKIP